GSDKAGGKAVHKHVHAWRKAGSWAWQQLTDMVFPTLCPVCKEAISSETGLCPDCWNTLTFIEPPLCDRLGRPFPFDPGPGIVSPLALTKPPAWQRLRAAVKFDETARTLVHDLKYRDHLNMAKLLGPLMARAGADLLAEADLVVPVPLYRFRLWQRRFNQAALLAGQLGDPDRPLFHPLLLQRTRATRAQVELDFADRRKNVRNAFSVPEERLSEVAGRRCVLVDDVLTTGATAEACTRALLKAGAERVDVIVFALVLNPSERHI
ncbi:MAG: ComF family protein, partial [Pseudomonadota bacterium]